ncbi:MAG: efflux RND transporter permease subunit [Spirochaetales bacterium]|nr:efflux RND transporter permease subunit [Spirochaetales bacterium]
MIEKIYNVILDRKMSIFALFLVASGAGIFALQNLKIDAVPDITETQVMINTLTGSLEPEEIEATITFPIETLMAGIEGAREVRSITKFGLSQVIVIFAEGTNLYFARQQVSERLAQADLPAGYKPELGPASTGLGEVLMYVLLPKEPEAGTQGTAMQTMLRLRQIQEKIIAPRLRTVEGVAEVDTNGGARKIIHVALEPDRLRNSNISLSSLLHQLDDLGLNRSGGYVELKKERILVRAGARTKQLSDLQEFPVRTGSMADYLPLRRLADVGPGADFRVGAATYDGQETILGTVLMRNGANSRAVALQAEVMIAQLHLPEDVEIKILYSRSKLVNATISTVVRNLVEGGILVIVVLFLLLGNFRAALLVSLTIPLAMLIAFSGMVASNISASLMSLGAIDFGLIVDGCVVIVENITRQMEKHPGISRRSAIIQALKEVYRPVFYGVLIIILVYVPILALTGVEGKLFRPMALTVVFALAAGLVIAMLLMPPLALVFLRIKHSGAEEAESRLFRYIKNGYRPVLDFSLRRPLRLALFLSPIFLLALFSFYRLGFQFMPAFDEGDMVLGMVRDSRSSLEHSIDVQKKSETILRQFQEVDHIFSRIGTPESATDPMGVNFSDTFLILRPHSQWPEHNGKKWSKDELYESMKDALEKAGLQQEVFPTQPIEMRFNEMLEGSRADVSLRIFGPDLKILFEALSRAEPMLERLPGVSEIGVDELSALRLGRVMEYSLNQQRIADAGLDPADLKDVFETAMSGRLLGFHYEGAYRFPIVARLKDEVRIDPLQVGSLQVETPGGRLFPLSRFLTLREEEQITTIARTEGQRYAGLNIYMDGSDLEAFVRQADTLLKKELNLPEGYRMVWGGQFKHLQKAKGRLSILIPLTLIMIFLLLWKSTGHARQAALIFACIPLALTGGFILLYLSGQALSVSASIGFIALSGIAVLNGSVLIHFYHELEQSGHSILEAVHEGTLSRLRPVLMTALVAMLGFLPMALNTGTGAEVQRPLATVVVGGLFSATLLTLLVLPYLYFWMENRFRK